MARRPRKSGRASENVRPKTSTKLSSGVSKLAGLSLLLALLTLSLYSPISGHPFANYDDGPYITDNPHIQNGLNWETIRWAATAVYAANWHPLTWAAHAVNFDLFGRDAGGHHITSMLLHAAITVLLFLLFATATRSVGKSWLVAAIFGVHPLNVEAVAWAAELKTLLCTFFFLLALGAYGWYARKPGIGRYALVAVLFLLGLASKPMAVTLPFVLLLVDYWPLGRLKRFSEPSTVYPVPQWPAGILLVEKLPLLALSAGSVWVTIYAQRVGNALDLIHPSLGARLANAVVSYAVYFLKTIIPVGLALYIPFPLQGMQLWKALCSVALLVVVTGLVFGQRRARPYLLTGWLFFLGTLVPVLGLLQVGGQARADRYMYIPMMGLLCTLVWGVAELAESRALNRNLRATVSAVILVLLFALCVRQISFWDSSIDLWTRSVAVTNDNAMAERNLAVAFLHAGSMSGLVVHAQRAVELEPQDYVSRVNLGNAYSAQKNDAKAVAEYEIVMQKASDPRLVLAAALSAAASYSTLGNFAKAETAYRSALRVAPDSVVALRGLEAIGKADGGSRAAASK